MDIGFFFFFQAEDGIRDGTVTGVQTCALPISSMQEGFGSSTVVYSGTPSPVTSVHSVLAAPQGLMTALFGSETNCVVLITVSIACWVAASAPLRSCMLPTTLRLTMEVFIAL